MNAGAAVQPRRGRRRVSGEKEASGGLRSAPRTQPRLSNDQHRRGAASRVMPSCLRQPRVAPERDTGRSRRLSDHGSPRARGRRCRADVVVARFRRNPRRRRRTRPAWTRGTGRARGREELRQRRASPVARRDLTRIQGHPLRRATRRNMPSSTATRCRHDDAMSWSRAPQRRARAIRRGAGGMAIVEDPVEQGFVTSFARPGGHVPGLSLQDEDLATRQADAARRLARSRPCRRVVGLDRLRR